MSQDFSHPVAPATPVTQAPQFTLTGTGGGGTPPPGKKENGKLIYWVLVGIVGLTALAAILAVNLPDKKPTEESGRKIVEKQAVADVESVKTSAPAREPEIKSARLKKKAVIPELALSKPVQENTKIYTAADDQLLRTKVGQTVTISGEVLKFKTSRSGATLYLLFKDEWPEFAGGVYSRDAEQGLDEEYLRSFVGEKVEITGTVKPDKDFKGVKGRMVIHFNRKDQLKAQ